jgi:CRISPR-associated endonuclease/helicase Cas3
LNSDSHNLFSLWAKTDQESGAWHPLVLHMLDVAMAADAILAREPESTRQKLAACLGLPWEQARPWLLLLIGCHDLGKACPGFQLKWDTARALIEAMGLKLRPNVDTAINHAFVSQLILADFLIDLGWQEDLADLVADAVGCHHGERSTPSKLEALRGNSKSLGGDDWQEARCGLFDALKATLGAAVTPTKVALSGPEFMLLAGLTSFADWIGSNDEWFPFGTPEDCADLSAWTVMRRNHAERALDTIGWFAREPLLNSERTFSDVFGFAPRPLQDAVAKAVSSAGEPCIMLVEAPMGEGKTEAAFYAHLELQRRLGHRGLYIALPTKATGNAMFSRSLEFLKGFQEHRTLDLQLLHGATLLNDSFQKLRLQGIYAEGGDGSIRAGEWFTHKKRALLSEYGVGTIDQALMPILPVRHNFVRLWGLANRVVVFDEIHAYDAYTGTLLINLLRWLLALDSSVILLSATLPPSFRDKLAKIVGSEIPVSEASYPRLSIFRQGAVEQIAFEADPARRRSLKLEGISPSLDRIRDELLGRTANGGMALALVNTVQRAQDLYRLFPGSEVIRSGDAVVGCRLADGTEVYLFHARFPADNRQVREDLALALFGKNGSREGKKILIATQVAEQSLDLDFDVMITDLAPIDLVLQRAGRLWRHARTSRPCELPTLLVAGLDGQDPPNLEKPLWWSAVYREDVLLRTWALLKQRDTLVMPDDIDRMVKAVYEDGVELTDALRERVDAAMMAEEGEEYAHKIQANQAVSIGDPKTSEWKTLSFTKNDEDELGIHASLIAKTRLSEASAVVIPLRPEDGYSSNQEPDFQTAKSWSLRSLSVSRKGVVKRFQKLGVPDGWSKSALLRNCIPLQLNGDGGWIEDLSVMLDEALGLVYTTKENV